ncbi:MAG TPA: glycosyltransferase [Flavitalea sp.]|nr:glycosyltransferase [Flavitalea sp.]
MKPVNLAAVVIMYHPEVLFLDNIFTYLDFVDRLYVIDNSEAPSPGLRDRLTSNPKIKLIANNINYGIARALNIAGEKAIEEGYDWLLTMDQDSFFDTSVLTDYLKAADKFPEKETVAVFGVPYDSAFLANMPAEKLYLDVNSMITSGSLVNLKLFNHLEGFNEKLFIDEVDHEYCYRAKIAGFRIICIRAGLMSHSLGKAINITSPLNNHSRKKTLHSPLRIYYIVRNGLYILKHFKTQFPDQAKKRKKLIYVTVKNNLLYGHEKTAVIKYTILGFWHYIKKRYYKL